MKIRKLGMILTIIYWFFVVMMIVSSANCFSPFCELVILFPVMPFGVFLGYTHNIIVFWLGYMSIVLTYSLGINAIGDLLQTIYIHMRHNRKIMANQSKQIDLEFEDKYSQMNKIIIIIILFVVFGVIIFKVSTSANEFIKAQQFVHTNLLNTPINIDINKILVDEFEYGTKNKCVSDEYAVYCVKEIVGKNNKSARGYFYKDADDYIIVKLKNKQKENIFGPFWGIGEFIVVDNYIILGENYTNNVTIINKYTGQEYYSEWMFGETWDPGGRRWTWMLWIKPNIMKQKTKLAIQIKKYLEEIDEQLK